jgi:hypothetical protein
MRLMGRTTNGQMDVVFFFAAIGSNPDVLRFLNIPIGGVGAEGGAGGGGGNEERLTRIRDMIEASSTADTEPPPPLTVAGLCRLAKTADASMSKHVCAAVTERLGDEQPLSVKLKCVQLLSALLARGSPAFCAAVTGQCEESIARLCDCDQVDPEHGAKPAELIRTTSKQLVASLKLRSGGNGGGNGGGNDGSTSGSSGSSAACTAKEEGAATMPPPAGVAVTLPKEVLQNLQIATADSEDAAPLMVINSIAALFMQQAAPADGGGGGAAAQAGQAEGTRKEEEGGEVLLQLRGIAQWLGRRLAAGATAPKLKTLILLEKLLAVAHDDNARLLVAQCKLHVEACLQWNAVDARHGDRPAALVRERAKAVLVLLAAPSGA